MSDAVGLLTYEQPPSPFLPGVVPAAPKTYSEDAARQMDTEVRAIVDRAHEQVRQLLNEKKTALQDLAQHLLEKEVLEGDELQTLLTPQPAPSAAFSAQKPQEAI